MTITATENGLAPALERTTAAERSLSEAIGALEMAEQRTDRELLAGYTGASALKKLREALRETAKAKELLALLGQKR